MVEILWIASKTNTISTSKIKNMIVIRKNRIEKGIRWVEFLSKPFSKGDDFSRLSLNFFEEL